MPSLVGRMLGPYRIDAPLGRGGMGEVFRGYQPALDRPVAIKVLYAHLLADSDSAARFRQEAQAAARLRHPNIVQVYDFGEADGAFYMVMELIEGRSLREDLRRLRAANQAMPFDEAAYVVARMAEALDYAHSRGVLHRDIKPDNVLIADPDPQRPLADPRSPARLVLADFGLAKLAGGTALTQAGHFVGTPFYMAPEQCAGEPLDSRADIYALGVLLYELLTGRVPFDSTTPSTVLYQQIYEPPPRPTGLRPDLPPSVEDVMLRVLAKRPDERYASAGDLARAFEQALRSASSGAFVPTSVLPPGTRPAPPKPPPLPAPTQGQTPGARPTSSPPNSSPLPAPTQGHSPAPPTIAAAVPSPAAGAWQPIPDDARGRYGTLQVTLAEGGQRALRLDASTLTIGREPANDLQLPSERVSRQHARIVCGPEGCQIEDLDSTNGTRVGDERLLPHYPRPLASGDVITIGGHRLRYMPAGLHDSPTVLAPATPRQTPDAAVPLALALTPTAAEVAPGSAASITLAVQNRGQLVDNLRIEVDGVPQEWWSAAPATLAVWPGGAQENATITFTPPRQSSARAGRYPIMVRVVSQADPRRVVEAQATLELLPFHRPRASLRPRRVTARGAGRYRLTLADDGNAPITLALQGSDDEEALRFKMPATLTLEPGAEQTLSIRVGRRRGRLFGREGRYAFAIAARNVSTPAAADPPAAQVDGELITRGVIPAWLTMLTLLAALLAASAWGAYTYRSALMPPAWAAEVERFVASLMPSPGPPPTLPTSAPQQAATPGVDAATPPLPQPDPITAQVNSPIGLRLRAGPGVVYPAIGQFEDRTTLALIEQHEGWFHVRGPGDEDGWVSGRFLQNSSAPLSGVPQADSVPAIPVIGYQLNGVRIGTGDGQRLRVVIDLAQLEGADPAGLFEAPDPRLANAPVTVYIRAREGAGVAPQYLNDAARGLADVSLTRAEGRDGVVVRIAPKGPLYLRPAFLTPDSPPRVVIDLCVAEDCPTLP